MLIIYVQRLRASKPIVHALLTPFLSTLHGRDPLRPTPNDHQLLFFMLLLKWMNEKEVEGS